MPLSGISQGFFLINASGEGEIKRIFLYKLFFYDFDILNINCINYEELWCYHTTGGVHGSMP